MEQELKIKVLNNGFVFENDYYAEAQALFIAVLRSGWPLNQSGERYEQDPATGERITARYFVDVRREVIG